MRLSSYRYRIPLSLVGCVLLTAAVLGGALAWETYRNLIADRIAEGERMLQSMAPVLIQALKHDDVWLAWTALREPVNGHPRPRPYRLAVALDRFGHVFASSRPRDFRVGTAAADLPGPWGRLFTQLREDHLARPVRLRDGAYLYLASALHSEGDFSGLLVIGYPVAGFWARFREILWQGGGVLLALLAPITLVGWYWGRRMASPLVHLSHCMVKARTENLESLHCQLPAGRDEIGELARRFQQLLAGLREKQLLEQKMFAQERMAAIGRLAASVAHEINNPVGGMLVALDTWRHHNRERQDPPERLLSLLERGLHQIADTVSALLVESRGAQRDLTPQDIDDVATLLKAQRLPAGAHLHWHNGLHRPLPLPATPVRQILLNLASNALQAIGPGQNVTVRVRPEGGRLRLQVADDGEPIPAAALDTLFEPFQSHRPGGTGLGLWITYQLVQQLGGQIEVRSDAERTVFDITLPIPAPTARDTEERHADTA